MSPAPADDERERVLHLLLENRTALFAFVLSLARDFDRAEEVFQEVSLVVCRRYRDFTPGTGFGAWAREIARRTVLAHRRSSARLPVALPEESLLNIQQGFDRVCGLRADEPSRRLSALYDCMERLAESARRLLSLRYGRGLALGALAEALGQRPESVRKSLYRARVVLRECIERTLRLEEEP